MVRVAAIDIGTNSVLLSVAEQFDAGSPRILLDRATVTRLGQGVDRTRLLHPDAMTRTLDCLRNYADELRTWQVDRLTVVGTSALRDAGNAESFTVRAAAILGATPLVIEGQVEAELTFRGALSGLSVAGPVVVVDIGGGSTEVIAASVTSVGPSAMRFRSFNVGCVRLTERHVLTDPPDPEALSRVAADTREALREFGSVDSCGTLVAVAGTATTLAAIHLGLATYDPSRVHGCVLRAHDLERLTLRLSTVSHAERCALAGLDPNRADVIVAGSVMLSTVAQLFTRDRIVVSDRGVRFGLIDAMLTASQS